MSVFNKAWLRIITFFVSVVSVVLVVLWRVPPEGAESLGWSCSCRRCIMGTDQEDDWFIYHYDPGAAPLLTRRNSRLAPDTERWWRGLQPSRLEVNYTELVERLFSLFPDQERYCDGGPGRCRTCAVVGNSGNLLGSAYGPLIDQHDLVIRINKGPTEGYERDVGSKVTHRMLYPESAVDLDNDTHLVLFPYKIRDLQWIISVFTTQHITRTYKRVKHTIKANENKVMILHPAFLRYVYESWLQRHGKYPSTGFITLIFALHICDEVNVFGFGATGNGAWHHYFDKSRVNFKRGPHGGDYENITIHRLQQQNKIHIYKGYR